MEINEQEPGVMTFDNLSDLNTSDDFEVTKETEKQDVSDVIEKEKKKVTNPLFDDAEDSEEDTDVSLKEEESEEEDDEAGDSGEKKAPVNDSETSKFYKGLVKDLWGDSFDTLVKENDEGEEVEVSLDEIELDADTFKQIYQSQLDAVKEKVSQGKIAAEGISEFTKSLIEIDKRGGNVTEMLQMKQQIVDPLDTLDLDDPNGQKDAVYLYYKVQGTKTDKEIDILLKHYEEEGVLEDLARQADSALREDANKRIEQEKEIAIEAEKKRTEMMKSYKKDIRGNLDQKFQLKDTVKAKIVDMATKTDKENKFEIDKLYGEWRRDPERMSELALFLLDPEEFKKQISRDEVKNTKLETSRKLRLTKKSPGDIDFGGSSNKKPNKESVILFDELGK